MNNDLKSLAQIAAECNVTKQAAYKRVNGSPDILERLQPHTVTSGTRKYYTLQGQAFIKALFTSHQSQPEVNQRSTRSQPEKTAENIENTTNAIKESQPEVNQRSTNSQPLVNSKSTESQPEGTDTQSGAGASDTANASKNNTAIAALEKQLEVLQQQLQVKDKQISELTTALACSQEQQRALTEALTAAQQSITAAQALHAGTLQERLTVNEEQGEARPDPETVTAQTSKEHSEGEQPAEDPPKKSLFARLFKRK